MKIKSESNNNYVLEDGKQTFKLSIFLRGGLLKIKINDEESSYTYSRLVDNDKKFRAFYSIKDIYLFILYFIKEEKIEIINKRTLILKDWGKDIAIAPLKISNLFSNIFLTNLPFNPQKNQNKKLTQKIKNFKLVKTFNYNDTVNSICFLKDGRLVSGTSNNEIIIHKLNGKTPNIIIKEDNFINTLCALENGGFASDSFKEIRIWEVNNKAYELKHKLIHPGGSIKKIIELKDGKLCSQSKLAGTIIIWDNRENYKCIGVIETYKDSLCITINSIIEIDKYIIAAHNKNLVVWKKSTCEYVISFADIYCTWNNALAKVDDNTIIIGGINELFVLDVRSFQHQAFHDKNFGSILSICALESNEVLLGNGKGEIICCDRESFHVLFKKKIHEGAVFCLVESEDNKIFSSSQDKTIKIHE